MSHTAEEVLALSAEAALLLRGGKVVFANAPAHALLGDSCLGKSARELLGMISPLENSPVLIGQLRIGDTNHVARLTRAGDEELLFFSPLSEEPPAMSEAFLVAVRNELSVLALSNERLARCAENREAPSWEEAAQLARCHDRLLRMSENASLVFSRGHGSVPFQPEPLDLRFLCNSVMEAASAHFPAIRFVWAPGKPVPVLADRHLVTGMLLNVISNAIRHAAPCRCISLGLCEQEHRVLIMIRDDGCGLSPEKIPCLFERFRYPFTISEMGGGAGLGLSAVRTAVELHSGAMLVESREGRGTTVHLALAREHGQQKLCTPPPLLPCSMRQLQIGLSDCLELSFFTGAWAD